MVKEKASVQTDPYSKEIMSMVTESMVKFDGPTALSTEGNGAMGSLMEKVRVKCRLDIDTKDNIMKDRFMERGSSSGQMVLGTAESFNME